MRKHMSRVAGLLSTLALVGITASTAQAASAQPDSQVKATPASAEQLNDGVTASSCFGGAQLYSKKSNRPLLYAPDGKWLVTSSRCSDINVRPKTNRYMKICFGTSGSDCQANWTLAKANQWNAVAKGVKSGSRYIIWFRSNAASNGAIAH